MNQIRPLTAIAILGTLCASMQAVAAPTCALSVKVGDNLMFDTAKLEASASCEAITIKVVHAGKLPVEAMGHNVVVSRTVDAQSIMNDGMAAGPANGYLKKDDPRVLLATPLVGAGQDGQGSAAGSAFKPGGDYQFFCTFPGHGSVMKGPFVVVP
jgi:azurin